MVKLIFSTKYTKCHSASTNDLLDGSWKEVFSDDLIRYHSSSRGSILVFECIKPDIKSPMLDSLFGYLKSNDFRKLSLSTRYGYINVFRDLYTHLEGKGNLLKINTKGFWIEYFKLVSKVASKSHFNSNVRLVKRVSEKSILYGVNHCKEIKYALKELPKTVNIDKTPRSTLGERLLGKNNTAKKERRLWRGFNSFLESSADILIHHNSCLYDFYKDDLKGNILLWRKNIKKLSWCRQPIELRDMGFDFFSQAFDSKDEKLLSLHKMCNHYVDYHKPSVVAESFVSKRLKKLVKERINQKRASEKLVLSTKLLDPSCVILLIEEELVVFKFLLAKWQFTHSMVMSITPSDITQNDTINTIQISENKNRSGSNPDSTRGHQVIFERRKHPYEYRYLKYFIKKLKSSFEHFGFDLNTDSISSLPYFTHSQVNTLGCFENPSFLTLNDLSTDTKYFLTTYKGAKESSYIKQKNAFSISNATIAQTQKVMLFDYNIELKDDNRVDTTEDDVQEELESNLRVHTRKTDINTYESRNLSPILLEADHLVGKQVADLMMSEAKAVRDSLQVMSLSDLRDFYGLSTDSEVISRSDLTEFVTKTGFEVTEFLGIKRESEIILVKHPLVLAMMKLYIQHIDDSLSKVIIDQISVGSTLSDKVIQIEGLRVVIASLAESFDEVLHAQADEIIDEFEIPHFPPLF